MVLLPWAIGGCAHGTELALPVAADTGLARVAEPGVTFAGRSLRERRETVLAALADDIRFVDPRCTNARLAPVDGRRRAFPIERCEHAVATGAARAPTLAGRSVSALVTHFVDGRLARLDAYLAPLEAGAPDTGLTARLDARLGPRMPSGGGWREPEAGTRWALGEDVVERTSFRLSVFDGRVLAALVALDEEDPTALHDRGPTTDGDATGTAPRR